MIHLILSEIGECKLTSIKPKVNLRYNAQHNDWKYQLNAHSSFESILP